MFGLKRLAGQLQTGGDIPGSQLPALLLAQLHQVAQRVVVFMGLNSHSGEADRTRGVRVVAQIHREQYGSRMLPAESNAQRAASRLCTT